MFDMVLSPSQKWLQLRQHYSVKVSYDNPKMRNVFWNNRGIIDPRLPRYFS